MCCARHQLLLCGGLVLVAALRLVSSAEPELFKNPKAIRDGKANFGSHLGSYDRFGTSTAFLGDVNGDGVADLAAGMPNYNFNSDDGAVLILLMMVDQTVGSVNKIGGYGDQKGFGYGVTGLGDWDGDGVPDMAVGAPEFDSDDGRVAIITLKSDASAKGVQWLSKDSTNMPNLNSDFFGMGLSAADFSGDGVVDLAVGETGYDSSRGAVLMLTLSNTGGAVGISSAVRLAEDLNGIPTNLWSKSSNAGYDVSFLGDLDADGVVDLAIGAPANYPSCKNCWYYDYMRGAVAIALLKADGTAKTATLLRYDTSALNLKGYHFGRSVDSLAIGTGDANSQVRHILAVGASSWDTGSASSTGGVAVFEVSSTGGVGNYLATLDGNDFSDINSNTFTGFGVSWWNDPDSNMEPTLVAGQPFRDESSNTGDAGGLVLLDMTTPESRSGDSWFTFSLPAGVSRLDYDMAGGDNITITLRARLRNACVHKPSNWPATRSINLRIAGSSSTEACTMGSFFGGSQACTGVVNLHCTLPGGGRLYDAVVATIGSTTATLPAAIGYAPPTIDWAAFASTYGTLPTAATTISLAADAWGVPEIASEYDVAVGGVNCTSLTWVSSVEMRCSGLPACPGRPYLVQAFLRGQLFSTLPLADAIGFDFDLNQLVYENPPSGYIPSSKIKLPDSPLGARVGFSGSGFGGSDPLGSTPTCSPASFVDSANKLRVEFGSVTSGSWTSALAVSWANASYFSATAPAFTDGMSDVRVTLFNIQKVMTDVVAVQGPAVSSVVPSVGIKGGDLLQVYGANFGTSGATVTVGPFPCSPVTAQQSNSLECTVTDGFGGNLEVVVTVNNRKSFDGSTTSYALGKVSSVTPPQVFVGEAGRNASFVIRGLAMAQSASQIASVAVGGSPCGSVAFVNSSYIECRAVDTSRITVPTGSAKPLTVLVGKAALDYEAGFAFKVWGKPTVTIASTSSPLSGDEQAADQLVTFQGTNFGSTSADILSIGVGNYSCHSPTLTDTTVTCLISGGGVGANLPVRIQTAGRLWSEPTSAATVSFALPKVTAIDPASAVGGDIYYNFTIFGSNLGTSTEPPAAATIGGVACQALQFNSSKQILCIGVNPVGESFTSGRVRITVGGQQNEGLQKLLEYTGRPIVTGANPPLLPPGGYRGVVLFGDDFGAEASALPSDGILVGGQVCANATHLDSTRVRCDVGPGVGAGVLVQVRTAGGLISDAVPALSYYLPTVTDVSPSYAVTGAVLRHNFTISGTGLGWKPSDVDRVSVGGAACKAVVWISDTTLRCLEVDLTASGGLWTSTLITVVIGGQVGSMPGLFTPIPPPSVSSVVPASGLTDGGYTLHILGTNFGHKLADVGGIWIGEAACLDVTFENGGELTCTAPAGVDAGVPVKVLSAGGAASAAGSTFSYKPPAVEAVEPSVFYGGDVTYTANVTGESFGRGLFDIQWLLMGSSACSPTEYISSKLLVCHGLRPPFSDASVVVKVGKQEAVTAGRMTVVGVPSISSMVPSSGPVNHMATVALTGSNLCASASDVRGVVLGEGALARVLPSSQWTWLSPTSFKVTLPMLVAQQAMAIRIVQPGRKTNKVTATSVYQYAPPTLTSVTPSMALTGPSGSVERFAIRGENLGYSAESIGSITVAGNPCSQVVWHDSSNVTCLGVAADVWAAGGSGAVVVTLREPVPSEAEQDQVRMVLEGTSSNTSYASGYVSFATTFPGVVSVASTPSVSSVSLVTDGKRHTDGGYWVTISGSGFGLNEHDIVNVTIGGLPVLAWTWLSGRQVEAKVPPGVGAGLSVEVENRLHGWSSSNALFTYDAPSVTSVTPSYLYSGTVSYTVNVTGESFGSGLADVDSLSIARAGCNRLEYVSSKLLVCHGLRPPFADATVQVSVGQQPRTSSPGLFSVVQAPIVSALTPASGAADNATTVTISGSNFGVDESHVKGIVIDTGDMAEVLPRTDWAFQSGSSLVVRLPPKVSASAVPIRVVQPGRLANPISATASFLYAAPAVSGIEPAVALTGPSGATESFVITGTNFGFHQDSIDTVTVAGNPCGTVVWHGSSRLECRSVKASSWASAGSGEVTLTLRQPYPSAAKRLQALDMLSDDAPSIVPPLTSPYKRFPRTFSGVVRVMGKPMVNSVLLDGDDGMPTRGGFTITISGSNFGDKPSDITAVTIGGVPALSWAWKSSQSLQAVVGPGVGHGLNVVVTNRVNGMSSPNRLLSYNAPVLSRLVPSYFFAGEPSVDLVVEGDNFCGASGLNNLLVVEVWTSGGAQKLPCPVVSMAPGNSNCSELLCKGLDLTHAADGRADVVVTLRSQSAKASLSIEQFSPQEVVTSVSSAASRLTIHPAPTVALVNPASAPIFGTADQVDPAARLHGIQGFDFGGAEGDVTSVSIGPYNVSEFSVVSDTLIEAVIPPGVGSNLHVKVTTRGGKSAAENRLFSFQSPMVTSLTPPYSLTGDIVADFNVTGEQLGLSQADVASVSVGGQPCNQTVWHSPEHLECFGVDGSTWHGTSVVVVVGNQASPPNAVFRSVPRPVVITVSPALVASGDRILVLGRNFGEQPSDVLNVTVDGLPCTEIEHQGSTAVTCSVPAVRRERANAADAGDTSALDNLELVLTTAGRLESDPFPGITYNGAGKPPEAVPDPLSAYRQPGLDGSVVLTWVFPEDDLSDDIPKILNFRVESTWQNATGMTLASDAIVFEATTRNSIPGTSLLVFQYNLRGAFGDAPVWVRMAAVNDAGEGPLTPWSPIVTETCRKDEFLQTQLPPGEWTCAPCPTGAFCGGLPYERMVPLSGFWRVPWSPFRLAFQECPFPDSCRGFDQASADAIEVANTTGTLDASMMTALGVGEQDLESGPRQLEVWMSLTRSAAPPGGPTGLPLSPAAHQTLSPVEGPMDGTGKGRQPSRRLATAGPGTASGVPQFGRSALVGQPNGGLIFSRGALRLSIVSAGMAARNATESLSLERLSLQTGDDWAVDLVAQSPTLSVLLPEVAATVTAGELTLSDDLRGGGLAAQGQAGAVDEGASSCLVGYGGNLCTACQPGYARKGLAQCIQCYSGSVVYISIVGIMLLVVAVVSFMIMQAIKSEGRESRPETVLMKILFTHMQQVAIAASFQLEWPDAILRLFSVMDSFSSVSENILSLDCVVPEGQRPGGSVFFSKSLVVLTTPVIVSAAISFFWVLLATTPRRSLGSIWGKGSRAAARASSGPVKGGKLRSKVIRKRSRRGTSVMLQGTAAAILSVVSPRRAAAIREEAARQKAGELEDAFGDDEELDGDQGSPRLGSMSSMASPVRSGEGTKGSPTRSKAMAMLGVSSMSDLKKQQRRGKILSNELRAVSSDKYELCCSLRIFKMRQKWLRDRMIVSLIVTAFLIHATLTKSVLRLFTCTTVGRGESLRSYLQFDLEVRCDEATARSFMVGVGLPAFVVYALGIPFLAFWVLRSRRRKLGTRRVRATYGFLYAGNKVKYYYWESVVMLRKVALAVVAVFLAPAGVAFQTYTAVMILGVAAVAQAMHMPYNRKMLNYFELMSLVTAFVTMVAGLYLSDELASHAVKVLATMSILVINSGLLVAFGAKLFGGTIITIRDQRRERRLTTVKMQGPTIRPSDRAKARIRRAVRAVATVRIMARSLGRELTLEDAMRAVRERNLAKKGIKPSDAQPLASAILAGVGSLPPPTTPPPPSRVPFAPSRAGGAPTPDASSGSGATNAQGQSLNPLFSHGPGPGLREVASAVSATLAAGSCAAAAAAPAFVAAKRLSRGAQSLQRSRKPMKTGPISGLGSASAGGAVSKASQARRSQVMRRASVAVANSVKKLHRSLHDGVGHPATIVDNPLDRDGKKGDH